MLNSNNEFKQSENSAQEEGHTEDRVANTKVLLTVHIDYNETSINEIKLTNYNSIKNITQH